MFPSLVATLVTWHFSPGQAAMRDCRQSMSDQMLQVNDLILGTVGFWWNQKHRRSPLRPALRQLWCERNKGHRRIPLFQIPYRYPRFTIWKLTFSERGVMRS